MNTVREELLREIKRLRKEIALQPYGSMRIESLTIELVLVYTQYVDLIEGPQAKAA